MRRWSLLCLAILLAQPLAPRGALAFCGFFVAKGDAKLFNKSSQVVIARDGDRTVMTMVNDYQGDPKEFAIVVPVPTVLQKDQIHIGDQAIVEHLDAYSAPRLVEYTDDDPCRQVVAERELRSMGAALMDMAPSAMRGGRADELVKIEARYTVGEYDILILSAKDSNGLATWLTQNGYRIPAGAPAVLKSYLAQKMHFFVAKVNLKEQSKLGFTHLRPIAVAYESPKFMLPVRLGTVNAAGPQELFVYCLTRKGRVEPVNYRGVRLPSDAEVPEFVKDDFPKFYRAMFDQQAKQQPASVFLEYAWNMAWCDPCASAPLDSRELRELGAYWTDPSAGGGPQMVFVTRLHTRYDAQHFPADIVFQETEDQSNFQGRFVIRHPWKGGGSCTALSDYLNKLRERQKKQAQTLADLTGWSLASISSRMPPVAQVAEPTWWQRMWNR
ncbi:MAG TPA: DUF2330 domain-containing protein [Candidatus Eisenbacteria bacterium]|nr:DUF2330 domain-containing protein [Candidatus Eisenbacteria bacterium]